MITISILQVANSILVSVVAWYFADQQKKIGLAKLRLDLFDRRLAVFDVTRWTVGSASAVGELTSEQERDFILRTLDAEFLFDEKMVAYIKTIQSHIDNLRTRNENDEHAKVDEARWFSERVAVLSDKFRPFMKLSG